jgi:ABC-2 type transport system permease protein
MLIAIIILLVTMAFVALPFVHVWIIILSIVLTTLAFAFMGLVTGFYAKNFDQVGLVPTFILTPLTYLGGVFYSADNLMGVWRTASHLNPIYHIVDLFRYGFTGVASGSPWIGVSILIGTITVFWGWGYWIVSSGRGLKA